MGKKKILMLVNFFPPSGGGGVYRPLSFVKYLPRLSWDVTVITPEPGEFWISDPALLDQIPRGVCIIRTKSLSGNRLLGVFRTKGGGGGSRRSSGAFEVLRRTGEFLLLPDTYVGWVPFAVGAAARLCRSERFDAVYSTSPPDSTHLAARSIARRFSIPWVADFRDPWIGLYLRAPPTPLHRMIHESLEGKVAGADRVLVTTQWQERKLKDLYPGCRVVRIPNGYDEEDFDGLGERRPADGPFTITHCGMLTLGRSSRPFLEGLSVFLKRSPNAARELRVVFIGARESVNEEWVRRFGLEGSVVFEDNVPHGECIAREVTSHALLLVKHDDARYRGLVPGKLFEYFGARRPVLAVVPEGEASELVTDLRRGEVARIGDPDDIAEKIGKMFTLRREGRLDGSYDLGSLPEYTRRAQAERLNGILNGMIGEGKQ